VIAFSRLGKRSRLGNHLFQYAFLRTVARGLNVPFYCPPWAGDRIFHLDDDAERATAPEGIVLEYLEPPHCTGYDEEARRISDGTDVTGYFQSPRYFDRNAVLSWYRFREEAVDSVRNAYRHVDFANSVGLHVRMGDFVTDYADTFYVARAGYYRRALKMVPRNRSIVVFSDDVPSARKHLGDLRAAVTYIEGHEPHEVLFLQSLCRDFICSPSSFSWWGAWLNRYPDKVVIAPGEGPFRPGSSVRNDDFWPEDWLKIRALWPFVDHRLFVVNKLRARRAFWKLFR